jgi:hypothetical protein
MSQGIVTTSRHAQTTGGGLPRPVGIALRAAAAVTYLILTSTVLTQLAAKSAIFQLSAQVRSGAPKVVTITVDGPAASVDVYCATTTERAPFDNLHVGPEGIMDAYHRWCSPVRSE